MEQVDLISLIVFAVITTFTPGPNNISCASHGLRHGYKETLLYISGIVSGFLLLMSLCMAFTVFLSDLVREYNIVFRVIGAVYIAWLGLKSLGISYSISEDTAGRGTFRLGFFLQLVNPKAILYGITIFTTFLLPVQGKWFLLLAFTLGFALLTFTAVSLWTQSGSWIGRNMKDPRSRQMLNIFLSLSLLYIAADLLISS